MRIVLPLPPDFQSDSRSDVVAREPLIAITDQPELQSVIEHLARSRLRGVVLEMLIDASVARQLRELRVNVRRLEQELGEMA